MGKVPSVGVADGGNQTMVEVGSGVSEGRGVSVGGVEADDKQAPRINVIASRAIFPMKQSPNRVGDIVLVEDCFVAVAPRNDG